MNERIIWKPQPKQEAFMRRPEDEALYGGAAGGGKSDALVIEALRQVHIPHYKGLILRKTFPQLAELVDKAYKYYPAAFAGARYHTTSHTWRFPSGAKIVFGSLQHDKDKYNYQGQAYDFIAFDELTHFTFDEYSYLSSRNRANGPGTRCYIRATANPGGIGHGWVKERFITAAPPMTTVWEENEIRFPDGHAERRRRSRVFVPSSVFDNAELLQNNPEYLASLASRPPAERDALLYGNWDSFSGQVFTEWRNDPAHYGDRIFTHVIDPFDPPDTWTYFRSFDWGYSKPFSVGWWAMDHDGRAYRILEFYGCQEGRPDTGLQMESHELFRHVAEVERTHPYLRGRKILGVADPAIWNADGGESIEEVARRCGVYFRPGDNARIPGWQQMHYRLRFDERGKPMMQIFKTCKDFIRTFPALVYSQTRVEDVDTTQEDHAADEARYFCMMRPIKPKPVIPQDEWRRNPIYTALGITREGLYNT